MFTLPPLQYDFTALEPYIDAQTMEIHHDKHHAAYVKNLNDTLVSLPDLAAKSEVDLPALLQDLDSLPADMQAKVRNNGGGHWNHTFFWNLLSASPSSASAALTSAINQSFGSLDQLKEKFSAAALGRFGSGWVWIVKVGDMLQIVDTPNQDNPLMLGQVAILGVDVWEHAYYLKYQNRRADYVAAFWNIVNWQKVSELYSA